MLPYIEVYGQGVYWFEAYDVMIVPDDSTVIAHAGDGNFHTVVLFDPTKEEQRREAERLNHFMVHTALAMEGTYSFQHFAQFVMGYKLYGILFIRFCSSLVNCSS